MMTDLASYLSVCPSELCVGSSGKSRLQINSFIDILSYHCIMEREQGRSWGGIKILCFAGHWNLVYHVPPLHSHSGWCLLIFPLPVPNGCEGKQEWTCLHWSLAACKALHCDLPAGTPLETSTMLYCLEMNIVLSSSGPLGRSGDVCATLRNIYLIFSVQS